FNCRISVLMVSISGELQSLLDRPNVHVHDLPSALEKLSRMISGGASDLTVITDFDHTLTRSHSDDGGKCAVTHEVFNHPSLFPELSEKFAELEKLYYPFEHLTEGEERVQKMEAWWRESNAAIVAQAFHRSTITSLISKTNIQLRDGASDFLHSLQLLDVPTLIFSAGIGGIISLFLSQQGVPLSR
ncbi:hypothetical protein PFISCL1PPCAC_9820, partial [Pristionchus fissidentatus]